MRAHAAGSTTDSHTKKYWRSRAEPCESWEYLNTQKTFNSTPPRTQNLLRCWCSCAPSGGAEDLQTPLPLRRLTSVFPTWDSASGRRPVDCRGGTSYSDGMVSGLEHHRGAGDDDRLHDPRRSPRESQGSPTRAFLRRERDPSSVLAPTRMMILPPEHLRHHRHRLARMPSLGTRTNGNRVA